MKTVEYGELRQAVAGLAGIEHDLMQTNERADMLEHFQTWMRRIWHKFPWPEICLVEERTVTSNKVALVESGLTTMGEVLAAYKVDPRTTEEPYAYRFTPVIDGIYLPESSPPSSVFCFFRIEMPDYSTYEATPTQTIPGRFVPILEWGMLSAWLMADGYHDKGLAIMKRAEDRMFEEIDVITRQQNKRYH